MNEYPFVIRNKVPLYYRGMAILFLAGVALITSVALRDGPPEPHKYWPFIIACFWAAGLAFLWWAFEQEAAVVRVTSPSSIQVERGKALRRQEHWTTHARFWIEDAKDSDGDPYFRLWMDAPGGKLPVKEGHRRAVLEELQRAAEAAIKGA
jgi:hypothetical protein